MSKPKIGVSSCLMGANIRFNGGHKHNKLITQHLGQVFDFYPVCPELAAGMPVPRPAIRLVQHDEHLRAVHSNNGNVDVTASLEQANHTLLNQLPDIDGFILTHKSPSCGLSGVKIYHPNGNPNGSTRGLFADALVSHSPSLPIEDSGRLNDDAIRENFVSRVLVHHQWKTMVLVDLTPQRLLDFHTRHKFLVLSHSTQAYQQLGQQLANLSTMPLQAVADHYFTHLMQALALPATRKRNTNVLQHLQGYVKEFMEPAERQALSEAITEYRAGLVPLVVPITLLRCFAKANADRTSYLTRQSYLEPYPAILQLRNSI